MTVQFLNASLFPTVTVEIGVSDNSVNAGTWGYSLWGTGTWTDNIAWTDVSTYVRSLNTSWARSRELNLQPANVLSMILDNRDGRFSPGNTLGPFAVAGVSKIRPRIAVRVRAMWNSVTYPVYYGFVNNWTDQPSSYGKDMVAMVQATDALSLLTLNKLTGSGVGARGDLPGTRVSSILTTSVWPLASAIDVGSNTLDVDQTNDSALTLLQNVATADAGLIFADRDGTLNYHGQYHRGPYVGTSSSSLTIGTGSKTFTVAAGLPIQVGDNLTAAGSYSSTGVAPTNYMSGTVTAYSGTSLTLNVTAVGGSGTVATWWLWWTRSLLPQMTFGGSGLTYDEPKLSNDDVYFYNTIVVTPQASTTTTSTTSMNSGAGSKTFTVANPQAGFVVGNTVRITSASATNNWMQGNVTSFVGSTLVVNVTSNAASGGPYADWGIVLVGSTVATAINSDSVSLYATRTLSVSSWGQNTTAQTLANVLLTIYGTPQYRVDGVRVTPSTSPATLWPAVLDARINDRHSVTIPLPSTTYIPSLLRLVHVSGISHSISLTDGWRVSFDYSSATPYL